VFSSTHSQALSQAKVKAITKLHRDGFMDRLEVRKERRKTKAKKQRAEE
jgi:hypothetical protein